MTFEEELAHGLYRYVELNKNNKMPLFIEFKENLTGFLSYGLGVVNYINYLKEHRKYNCIILENSNYTEKELCDIISQKLKKLKMIKKLDRIDKDF